MEAFLVSLASVATAEVGDRTQLLSLVLAARYRRPWPILSGVLLATLANHGIAGLLGAWFGRLLTPTRIDLIVGAGMIAMAAWALIPDKFEEKPEGTRHAGPFLATLIAFFLAEIGDKTQVATVALAAAYPNLLAVVGGTSCGMLIANGPVVFLGSAFSHRLPIKAIHYVSSGLFLVVGAVFLIRGLKG